MKPAELTAHGVLFSSEERRMATNKPRHGYERKRSQLQTRFMGEKHWTKRDDHSGEFMSQKKTPKKYKSVRRERNA